jgi:hypothetical protein
MAEQQLTYMEGYFLELQKVEKKDLAVQTIIQNIEDNKAAGKVKEMEDRINLYKQKHGL